MSVIPQKVPANIPWTLSSPQMSFVCVVHFSFSWIGCQHLKIRRNTDFQLFGGEVVGSGNTGPIFSHHLNVTWALWFSTGDPMVGHAWPASVIYVSRPVPVGIWIFNSAVFFSLNDIIDYVSFFTPSVPTLMHSALLPSLFQVSRLCGQAPCPPLLPAAFLWVNREINCLCGAVRRVLQNILPRPLRGDGIVSP